MDIHMPGMSGLQVLRALAGEPDREPPAVIFTTAYDEHAVEAFELHAVDYLLKPFSQERFVEAVQHALQSVAARDAALPALAAASQAEAEPLTRVLVRDGGKIFPLLVDAIECLRSDTKYTAIVSKGAATWCACRSRRSRSGSTRGASSRSIAPASSTSTSWWRWFPARTRSSRCS